MRALFIYLSLNLSLFNSPDLDCNSIKNGEFVIYQSNENGLMVETILERKDDIQYETNEQSGIKLKFKVEWLSDCQYTLTWLETLQDKNGFDFPKDLVVTVTILEITDKYYIQKSSSNLYEGEFESKIMIRRKG